MRFGAEQTSSEVPRRRDRLILLTTLVTAALAAPACGGEPATPERPNLLLITVDTTRADYLGAYGHPEVQTPNIDALAASGALFLNAIAPSQTTNPSHSSILTGLHLAQHGVYDNQTALADEAYTLAEILSEAGYATIAAVSAPHLNPRNSNFGQGFDTFLEAERGLNLRAGERNEALLERIRRAGDQRFFAWAHYFDPHGDYEPPAPFDTMYPPRDEHPAVQGRDSMDLAESKRVGMVDPDVVIPLYKGEISYLDEHIGALLSLLEELDIEDRTLVALVADHGESMTEKEIYFSHAGLYEQVLRVPLIMSLPGRVPAGSRVDALVGTVDLFPTVLELLGMSSETPETGGVSLVPSLSDPLFEPHEFLVAEAVNGVIAALYMGGYKYIKPYPSDWSMPESRLFKPADDPSETRDLKEAEPETARAMESFLDRWIETTRAAGLDSSRHLTLDPETERALRSLGYIR